MNSLQRPIEILLVEDNLGDVRLTQEALRDGKISNVLHHAQDGVEAMDFLYARGKFPGAPRPDLVLLDLNLPKKDGREVLAEVKKDPALATIPIVVLTTSKAEQDIARTYGLHANCYIVKPLDFEQFTEVVQAIESFWFCIVMLPSAPVR
jgi:CheY-like chemotaxis protein